MSGFLWVRLYVLEMDWVIYSLISWMFAMSCSVFIDMPRDLLRTILRNLFWTRCTFCIFVLDTAAQIWCPYVINGRTQVLMSFLILLLREISGKSFRSAGYARAGVSNPRPATLSRAALQRFYILTFKNYYCAVMESGIRQSHANFFLCN